MQRPEAGLETGIPGRSEGPKVGLCLAGMGSCQEASVAGLGEPWAEALRNGLLPQKLILAAAGVERAHLLLGELPPLAVQ